MAKESAAVKAARDADAALEAARDQLRKTCEALVPAFVDAGFSEREARTAIAGATSRALGYWLGNLATAGADRCYRRTLADIAADLESGRLAVLVRRDRMRRGVAPGVADPRTVGTRRAERLARTG